MPTSLCRDRRHREDWARFTEWVLWGLGPLASLPALLRIGGRSLVLRRCRVPGSEEADGSSGDWPVQHSRDQRENLEWVTEQA